MGTKWASIFNPRRVLAILILGSVVVLAVVLWRHLEQQAPEDILAALPKQVDLSLEKLHYTQNEEGQRRWTLMADKAEYQRDNSQALLEKVHLVLYRAGQFGEVTLDAERGRLEQAERQIDVWDHVVIKTSRQEQLFTEKLHYDGRLQRLSTDEPVRLQSPQLKLTGTGLQVDLDQGRLLVKKDVRMLIFPANKERKTHD